MLISCRLVFYKRCILNHLRETHHAEMRPDCSAADNFTWCYDGKLDLLLTWNMTKIFLEDVTVSVNTDFFSSPLLVPLPVREGTPAKKMSRWSQLNTLTLLPPHPRSFTQRDTLLMLHLHTHADTAAQTTLSQGDCLPALSSVAMPSWALM